MLWGDHPADRGAATRSAQSLPTAPRTGAQVPSRQDAARFALLQLSALPGANALQLSSGGHETRRAAVGGDDAQAAVGSTLAVIRELQWPPRINLL